jgi:hypothetical protein
MPKIMRARRSICAFMARTALRQPVEHRLRDDGVADVELVDLGDAPPPAARCGSSGRARRAPRGRRDCACRAARRSRSSCCTCAAPLRLGEFAGVQFDHRHPAIGRGIDLLATGSMNSATRMPAPASRSQALRSADRRRARRARPSVVSSARRSGTRQQSAGRISQAKSIIGRWRPSPGSCAWLQQPAQRAHVALLDVAPVFAQVQRDVVGAGLFGDQRGMHRIGIRVPRCWRSVAT